MGDFVGSFCWEFVILKSRHATRAPLLEPWCYSDLVTAWPFDALQWGPGDKKSLKAFWPETTTNWARGTLYLDAELT